VLIPPLQKLGLSVGTLKYTEHDGFEWDTNGKDTFRHRTAGSEITGIFGRRAWAFSDNRSDPTSIPFDRLITTFYSETDLVLVEGYRFGQTRKIEVMRPDYSDRAISPPSELLATYGERLFMYDLPHFPYGAEGDLARHIAERLDDLKDVPAYHRTTE
jgi:molybdopterin-guanine dinucleotide biosynthesis protein MobB